MELIHYSFESSFVGGPINELNSLVKGRLKGCSNHAIQVLTWFEYANGRKHDGLSASSSIMLFHFQNIFMILV